MEINQENIHLFYYWLWERQNIYWKKNIKKLPPPWTKDVILQQYKFTNTHRSLDRTTIWYHENIGKLSNERDIIFGTFVHRLMNRIETMELLMPFMSVKKFSYERFFGILDKARKSGQNIFTTAHMTTGVRFHGSPDKLDNIVYLFQLIHDEIDEIIKTLHSSTNLEELYWNTRKVNGFGPFLAYQFVLDMVNTGLFKFDLNSFSVAGPGCKRGIIHIFPNAPQEITFLDAMQYLRKHQHEYFEKFGFKYKFLDQLGGEEAGIHLADIENGCCEFSKYWKAYNGVGHPRNKYTPQAVGQIDMFDK